MTQRIDIALAQAAQRLAGCSPTARLDVDVLMAHVLGCTRAWLYTWGDQALSTAQDVAFDALVRRREAGEPIAYLTGRREFWGLSLETSPETLIPRPDTEALVDAALEKADAEQGALLDLGTGTGAIALAFAFERPRWQVTGADVISGAVALAQRNAERLQLSNAQFVKSDWFSALPLQTRFDLIVSNPPYLAEDDAHLCEGDVRFEPHSALVAKAQGLHDLHYLVTASRSHLCNGGWLLLEHGCAQGAAVRQAMMDAGYIDVHTRTDLSHQDRITLGCWGKDIPPCGD